MVANTIDRHYMHVLHTNKCYNVTYENSLGLNCNAFIENKVNTLYCIDVNH